MESYCSLCTFKVPQGANNLILCTLNTIHRLFFVTRLIINKINKVQWVVFKLENVLASLYSLKTMGLGSIIFKEWRVTWTFSYTYMGLCKWVSGCYLNPNEKFFSHIMARTSYILMRWCLLCTRPTHLVRFV
jgi:hypothetical protein